MSPAVTPAREARGAGHLERHLVEVVTPEGVALPLQVASAAERLGALLLDLLFQGLGTLAVALAIGKVASGPLAMASVLLVLFLVRNFYFAWFEIAWQGRTPGKRILKIRVVDRRGGPLSAEAVLARNLTREVELFLPLTALGGAGSLFPGAPGAARLVAVSWALVFGLLPLFNRLRLRVGDLVAGTLVVVQPEPRLLPDLAAAATGPRGAEPPFSEEQLDAYGIFELQVLEDLLREGGPGRAERQAAVAARIRQKIAWEGRLGDAEFLARYYAALRARLEARLLLGKRKADKHHRG